MANENDIIKDVFENFGYIHLDSTYEDPVEINFKKDKALQNFIKKNYIDAEIINLSGPGGGWPEIRYTGILIILKKFIKKFYDLDIEDVYFVRL